MKRTQLYLEENLWKLLSMHARNSACSVSELVRQAIREKYVQTPSHRKEVLSSVVGLWRDRADLPDTETYVRRLRRNDGRMRRLYP